MYLKQDSFLVHLIMCISNSRIWIWWINQWIGCFNSVQTLTASKKVAYIEFIIYVIIHGQIMLHIVVYFISKYNVQYQYSVKKSAMVSLGGISHYFKAKSQCPVWILMYSNSLIIWYHFEVLVFRKRMKK